VTVVLKTVSLGLVRGERKRDPSGPEQNGVFSATQKTAALTGASDTSQDISSLVSKSQVVAAM